MMYNYPFFNFSHFKKYPTSSNTYPYSYFPTMQKSTSPNLKEEVQNSSSFSQKSKSSEDTFFEIFGLKLYYDDILLICLIFFLYQEGVEDEFLLIVLILLLLS